MSESITTTIDQDAQDDLHGRSLVFYIDDTFYGIELYHITDIISVLPIIRIPSLPHYIKGLINLRGKVVPVIDVRLKFNQEERAYDDKTCIINVVIGEMQVGLIVDGVAGVFTLRDSQNSLPDMGKNTDRYLSSVSKVDGRVILNIDCNKFFQSDLQMY